MRVLIDTNVLLRLANAAQDPSFAIAESAIENLRYQGHTPTIVPQNLYEFWAVATRPQAENGLGMTTEKAKSEIASLAPPLFELLQDERAILQRWMELVVRYEVKGKSTHDARLVSAMLRHGISHVLSFNNADFNRFHEIVVVTPQQVNSRELT